MTDRQPTDIPEEAEETTEQPSPRSARPKAADDDSRLPAREGAADELPWIDDRVSKLWVALIAGVFALIFVYGLLFGQAGALTPASPSPSPAPVITPSPAASPAESPSPPAGSPSPASPTPGASPSPAAPPSPAAS